MTVGGVILRFFNLGFRVLQTFDSVVILGIFSYYLALLAENHKPIPIWMRAVEGLSGGATLYGLLACIFTCCLGGVRFFAGLAVVLDICCVGAMVAIAILTRDGIQSCSGNVSSPLGSGPAGSNSPDFPATPVNLQLACRLEKVCFAVSIIGIGFFLLSIPFQIFQSRMHQREKKFGPSPANNYGKGRRGFFWPTSSTSTKSKEENSLLDHPPPVYGKH